MKAALGTNTRRGLSQHGDGTWLNFIEQKRMETILKTKQRIVKWTIIWIENQSVWRPILLPLGTEQVRRSEPSHGGREVKADAVM